MSNEKRTVSINGGFGNDSDDCLFWFIPDRDNNAAQTAAKEETSQAEQASPKEAEESSAESAGGKVYGYITAGA